MPKAKAYAERAFQIDERLAEAHASLGIINSGLWQWAEAEKEFKRAIELNPNYPTAHHWYCIYLRRTGRYDESLREIQRAQERDPLSNVINGNVVTAYLLKGDINAAFEQSKKMIEFDPNSWFGHNYLGQVYLKQGRNDEAIAKLQESAVLSERSNSILSQFGYALAISGRRAEALAITKELEERYAKRETPGIYIGAIYAGLGEKDQAFAWLEKDFQARSGTLPNISFYPTYEPLRSDARYAELLRRMNLPPQ